MSEWIIRYRSATRDLSRKCPRECFEECFWPPALQGRESALKTGGGESESHLAPPRQMGKTPIAHLEPVFPNLVWEKVKSIAFGGP